MALDGIGSGGFSPSSFPADIGSVQAPPPPPPMPDVGAEDVSSPAGNFGFSGDSSFDAGGRVDPSTMLASQGRVQQAALTPNAVEGTRESPALSALSGRSAFEPSPASAAREAATQARPPAAERENLERGSRGAEVRQMQEQLKRAGFNPGPLDGKFGPLTERAVRNFQQARNLETDGVAGPKTMGALEQARAAATRPEANGRPHTAARPQAAAEGPTPVGDPAAARRQGVNGEARIDRQPRGPGLATGNITVNGNTYRFNSGSSRLFSTPTGEFRVTAHRNSRNDAGFVRDGVGYSFLMEDPRRPGSDRFYDPRAGRDRTHLRIHPDGGATGTAGCIGIVGDAATQRRFRNDLNAELARNNGVYRLRVR
jgi:hypothetical protein